ncbi:YtpI family protein [Caldibacillus lycopersici]|uniref:YtpI family protein n=1 Tax=Perspicuibacillus lycopersici TaxID=1325689 RepID=A0AAE3LR44_9BACI|nr:YtpI family protein [Perspicuibacillus lycopersici]MCU9614199.1 YtpI family protein [Perspicuibacillus lycopersici]
MPILVCIILVSLSFYIYYKMKQVRSQRPIEKKWLAAKSSMALGLFVGLFGINRLFITQTPIAIIIGSLFIIVGIISIWTGYKAYKYYYPYVVKEYEEANQVGK